MSSYKEISKLYEKLDHLSFILRNFTDVSKTPQKESDIFQIESSPFVNKRSFDVSKVKYRKYILPIIEQEIKEAEEKIKTLTLKK